MHANGRKWQKRKAIESDNLEKQNTAKCLIWTLPFNRKGIREQGKRMLFDAKTPQFFLEQEAEEIVFCKETKKFERQESRMDIPCCVATFAPIRGKKLTLRQLPLCCSWPNGCFFSRTGVLHARAGRQRVDKRTARTSKSKKNPYF